MNAFPNVTGQQGMTLRDYFASDAMKALITKYGLGYEHGYVAKAYEIADLMMKERERKYE
jgi:hypothetical protein